MTLTFDQLRSVNLERCPMFGHGLKAWNALEWAGAMCGEAGEAANVAKKLRRLEDGCDVNTQGMTRKELVQQLATEIAGAVVYADLLAASEGIDLGEAVADEFNRVSQRVGYKRCL
jgi:NTP pyrophosphatase (non-canonical NTP hydrolase)